MHELLIPEIYKNDYLLAFSKKILIIGLWCNLVGGHY